ncbi:MAG: ATP-binding cassette domain-containing protein [Coriobacteriia bacterium]|nr:ATP-binding cassette domain-containing protein [Coriobacteriia bacterium]
MSNVMRYYQLIGEVQSLIRKAECLEDALQECLRLIESKAQAEAIVLWYHDQEGGRLHPLFWLGPDDLTSCSHTVDEGIVGRVFTTQEAVRAFDFRPEMDPTVQRDFTTVQVKSLICVPLSSPTDDLGCIQFINRTDGAPWTEEDADVFEIMALSAGMALSERDDLVPVPQPGNTILEAHGIIREFQNGDTITRVVKGVNLNVYEGEFLTLLGESGCGKSTLLNIIGGLDQATEGQFFFRETDMSHASQHELTNYRRENTGFIFQSYNLMPNLTTLQNLRLIAELVDDPMDCMEALALVGLQDKAHNYPSQLSGGQQQRVSIARALVKKPKILFADEPTAALDYATSIEVLQVLENVIAKQGTTMVMVTHNEEITRMADRVVRLRNGYTHEITVNRRPAKATDLVW